jgi:carbamoylphosphate synthase large subunit
MQLERAPLTVTTRLQTYENMIIEELSAPDDYMTLNALKCTVHLKQIIFANVAEIAVSQRKSTAAPTSGGQQSVQTVNKTLAKATADAAGITVG